jgi:hypothetical protein
MLKRSPAGESPWQVEQLDLNSNKQTANEQIDALKVLEAKVVADNPEYVCVLIDDLLAEAYPTAENVYDKLIVNSVVFMVFTSCDPAMKAELGKALHSVRKYPIEPLTPDDAITYVKARYALFRDSANDVPNQHALFPFDEDDIRTAVKVRVMVGAPTEGGPVNLRLLASILQSSLENLMTEIANADPGFDCRAAAPALLEKLKIRIAQAYKVVVRA